MAISEQVIADDTTTSLVREGVVIAHTTDHISIAFPTQDAHFGKFSIDSGHGKRGGYDCDVLDLPWPAVGRSDVKFPGSKVKMTIEFKI